ncbi:MAG: 3-hydroxyacyl-CoA dehydrogenase NAD-binding domain-containing protein [Pseudomonadota bacterium]|nr:3-hydroxyacyl-CoA dehydrogenase NAD-binding domain-containing protein [Pseudomonadota bacterium]
MSDVINIEIRGAIAILTIDNPPANALSFAVCKGLSELVPNCMADQGIAGLVLTGAGRMFMAGADIREFSMDRPTDVPDFHVVLGAMEDAPKPIVAAINGIAFGGGLELAMGCHYRLIAPVAQVGQPEIKLGFIPGAGGTQRLPRLAGIEAALDMIVGGDPILAERAVELGIADELVEGDLVERACEFAAERAASGESPAATGQRNEKITGIDASVFADYREKIAGRSRGLDAPEAAIKCIQAATTLSLEEGLALERDTFVVLRDSDSAKAMRYMFFAEREVAKIPDVPRDTAAKDIKIAAIIGSGTMGGGIAMSFANAGIPVTMMDISEDSLAAGMDKVRTLYSSQVSRGRLGQDAMDERMDLISGTTDYAFIKDADIVIEAVFEDMKLKKNIFAELDRVCKADAILASNTSTLDINEIGAVTRRPDKVCGTHFFSPANVMKLLENVRTDASSKETIASVMKLAKVLGKVGVLVGVCNGFVGNRMLGVAARITDFMVEEGALPWQVDAAIYDFGFAMGPFAVNDLAGIDVRYLTRTEQKKLWPDRRHPVLPDKVYEMGRYGQKTNAGWYDYESGARKGTPSTLIEKFILDISADMGIKRRQFSDQEIVDGYVLSMANSGSQILEEGLALRASDIDVIWHYGYGFPRYRGGPMFYADLVGLDKVYDAVSRLYDTYGEWVKPSELLVSLAKDGKRFADYVS